MVDKCLGCGAIIQTDNPNEKGYIDKDVYMKRKADFFCKRCFALRHYNRDFEYPFNNEMYQKNIAKIKKDNGLIVYVIDLFDLEGSLIDNINQIFKTDKVIIVLNKVDLHLDSLNLHKVEIYVRQYLKKRKVNYLDLDRKSVV